MDPELEAAAESPPARATRGKRVWWAAAALVVLGALVVARVVGVGDTGARDGVPDELKGDGDSAAQALEDAMDRLPVGERMPVLLRYAASPYPGLRYATIDQIAEVGGPQAADAVERAFTDSASQVRQRAVEVLPTLDRERGIRLLASALRDHDMWIREAAASQAAVLAGRPERLVDRRAVPALIGALGDANAVVCVFSMSALRKLTGQTWRVRATSTPEERRPVVDRWKAWWRTRADGWQVPPELRNPPRIVPLRVDPAPRFSLKDVDGRRFTLADQRGRLTLLNFWGTWCAPCAAEVADLARLDAGYRERGLDILGLAMSEPDGEEGLKRWCAQRGVAYRQALATRDVTRSYGHIHSVPVSVLIDRQGRIRYRWEGERDYDTFRAAVDRLLAEGA